ncbi:hypothetical protein M378DRAFT_18127 [Amanita muscaria Koide BX008]|uniref:CCHC-type domain-containing protein n=1 Tax=Amanita muscaria (strain Koide BX008) TaxID=946122 RepID=A0A0C2WF52_AMAMK|nr:hypothetical protein M378DRAFT_18127 [Amanita muscaria Koide BX008]
MGGLRVASAENLMQLAIEEWDRRENLRKSFKMRAGANAGSAAMTSLATSSSERPGATAGGGRRNKRPERREIECWNCGEKGHRKSECPNPKAERTEGGSGSNMSRELTVAGQGNATSSNDSRGKAKAGGVTADVYTTCNKAQQRITSSRTRAATRGLRQWLYFHQT